MDGELGARHAGVCLGTLSLGAQLLAQANRPTADREPRGPARRGLQGILDDGFVQPSGHRALGVA